MSSGSFKMYKQYEVTNHIFNIYEYVKAGFGIKYSIMVHMP